MQQEKLIVAGNIKQLDLESTANGVTIKPYQVLQDANSVEIYMEVIAPDTIELDEQCLFRKIEVNIKEAQVFSTTAYM